jgi:hypothetical protein
LSHAIANAGRLVPGLRNGAPLTRREACARLVERLERQGIRYCLVGDSRSFAEDLRKDLDVLADLDSFGTVLSFVKGFSAEIEARVVQLIQYERNAWYFCLAWTGGGERPCFLQVDFCQDFCQDGRFFLSHQEILKSRVWEADMLAVTRGYFVPAPALEFIYYVIKRIDKGLLARRDCEHIRVEWSKDPAGARRQLERFWSSSDADFLADAVCGGDWERIKPQVPRLRARLRENVPVSVRGYAEEIRLRWRRMREPPGVTVGLAGASADLRSAVAEELVRTFAAAFYHFHVVDLRESCREDGSHPNASGPGLVSRLAGIGRRLSKSCRRGPFAFWRHRLDLGRAALIVVQCEAAEARPVAGRSGESGAANGGRQVSPRADLWMLLTPPNGPPARAEDLAAERRTGAPWNCQAGLREWRRVDASKSMGDVAREVEGGLIEFLSARLQRRLANLP